MPRQARLDSPGTLHHVIIRGIEKKEIVGDKYDRTDFVKRMGELAQETGTSIYAWSLMRNHGHILLKSGSSGLSKYMRRFLTGYAIGYNIRHKRHGHLFQNRYKSIVCDEDAYFKELVRYIHLNPLRAGIVKNMSALDRYPWCGHCVIMGRKKMQWQDRNYVLSWFGRQESEAKRAYREYVEQGIKEGRRDDLVGGGLVRTLGGWSQVLSLRRSKEEALSDERILGSGDFVERTLAEAENEVKYHLSINERRIKAEKKIHEVCKKEGASKEELQGGSRRGRISQIRAQLAIELTEDYGLTLAETGRQLGVSTSAISKIYMRRSQKSTQSR
ncbi:MAG: transposase [Deltaproteobacteria bacterium]|nr:transposase [Deltaproteobacteria bacterium]